jgi:hypothetical protein
VTENLGESWMAYYSKLVFFSSVTINLLIILSSQGLTRITFPNRRQLQGSTGKQEMPVKHFRQYIIERVCRKRESWPNFFPGPSRFIAGPYRQHFNRIGTERQEITRTFSESMPILHKDRCGRMPPKLPREAGTYQQGPV